MKDRDVRSQLGLWLAIGGLWVLFACAGCGSAPEERPTARPTGQLRQMDLSELRDRIVANGGRFWSLTADCDVVLRSPAIPLVPPEIQLSGTLELRKPGKVHVVLGSPKAPAIELIGDGKNYVVRMRTAQDTPPYGGEYGAELMPVPGRIHFVPEDLSDALEPEGLFAGAAQVLRAYPAGWNVFAGSFTKPLDDVAAWHIDSLAITEQPKPAIRLVNSITIDGLTEQIIRIDKFRWDGSLRTRIWFCNTTPVPVADTTVEIPSEIMLWYPPPLEDTMVYLRLKKIKVNVEIPDTTFTLTE